MNNSKQRILLTRPRGQNNELKNKLSAKAFIVSVFPCIEIERVTYEVPQITPDSLVIFTSQNAVRFFDGKSSKQTFAIGPSTQSALEKNDISSCLPLQFNSEGLLALDALQNIKGKKIFIICGENPRPLLSDTLTQRGATVELVHCYRRIQPVYTAEEIEPIVQQHFDALVSTSTESLNNLNELLTQHRSWLYNQPLLVISDKMKALAMDLGFISKIIVCKDATNESIVDSLMTLYNGD